MHARKYIIKTRDGRVLAAHHTRDQMSKMRETFQALGVDCRIICSRSDSPTGISKKHTFINWKLSQ